MKKLEVEKNAELVADIKDWGEILYNYNLILYYINDSYLYIYSRVTKKASLYLYDNEF